MLSPDERQILLRIARESIVSRFQGRLLPAPQGLPEALRRPAGAFVTLKREVDLRGSTASIVAVQELHEMMAENARKAAFDYPRFPPLEQIELPQSSLEISDMGPLERVDDVTLNEPGRDGLIVRQGR